MVRHQDPVKRSPVSIAGQCFREGGASRRLSEVLETRTVSGAKVVEA
jgi:hypothetical protein